MGQDIFKHLEKKKKKKFGFSIDSLLWTKNTRKGSK